MSSEKSHLLPSPSYDLATPNNDDTCGTGGRLNFESWSLWKSGYDFKGENHYKKGFCDSFTPLFISLFLFTTPKFGLRLLICEHTRKTEIPVQDQLKLIIRICLITNIFTQTIMIIVTYNLWKEPLEAERNGRTSVGDQSYPHLPFSSSTLNYCLRTDLILITYCLA